MIFGFIPPEIWSNLVLAFKYIYIGMPVWLPVTFLILLFDSWIHYKRLKFWQKEGSILLEIKLPREITKSPAAMEVVLEAFNQGSGEGTWWARIIEGKTRSWFSLELVSMGGNIKFFIWTKPRHKNVIESAIYSQYPEIEIYEVEDYTKPFYYDPQKNNVYGIEFALAKPDPYPIKTYVEYGLEKDPKEELKVDPMTPVIEFLGSIPEGHNIWFQIIIRAHAANRFWGVFGKEDDSWEKDMEKEKEKIIEKLKTGEFGGFPRILSKGETEVLAALERSVSKHPFDVGIRAIYIADKDKFNPANIGGILGAFKQYGSNNLNGFKPSGWFDIFDYPWQKWWNRQEKLKPLVLQEYKMRRFFYSPLKNKRIWWENIYSKPFVLNTEELATIYHFPGAVAATPTLEKIPSLKSKAPPNLPI